MCKLTDDITCPKCKFEFEVSMWEGEQGTCPGCNAKFFVDSSGKHGSDEFILFPDWN